MADAIVTTAIERISNLLIQEAAVLSNVRKEVERLQAELRRMQCFLKYTDCKQDQDEVVRNWVADIREVAYDAEDVIDAFLLTIPRREVGFCGLIKKSTSMLTKAPQLRDIGQQIYSIRNRIGDISTSMQTYGIKFVGEAEGSSSASEMQRRLRRIDPYDDDEHVIRLESTTKELLDQLMLEDDQRRVVSIVGMGGIGKTTLAKLVYNRFDVKRHFDCLSWAFISQQFSPGDVFSGILREVGAKWENMGSMKEEDLIRTLKDVLKEKRYLVVLDDIWKEEAWDSLKRAFPKGKKGSKVLFTTRVKEVASYADPRSSPVEPPFLTNEEGWELLSRTAFPEDIASEQGYAPEFERIGKEIVRKCGGLPLAIAVLGGLLANKSLKEWEMVQKDINAQFTKLQQRNQYAGVDWILALSYQELPFRLKPCFLYLSQFPEDMEIDKTTLIRMWIAEGFLPQPLRGEGDETMEDVGEQFLEELANRCMVQVSERDHTGIGIKKCRMHDLMRDMCVSKAREESFLGVIEHQKDIAASMSKSRRIAVHKIRFVPSEECSPRLRSLLYLNPRKEFVFTLDRNQVIFIFKNLKLLRVLNIQNVIPKESYIPREIGDLIHLRYLGLRNTILHVFPKRRYLPKLITPLPASIGNLKSLYTLDLRRGRHEQNDYWKVPDVMWKLKCLRQLLLDPHADDKWKCSLDTLRQLETLKWIEAKSLIRKDALLNLTNLRNLGVVFQRKEEAEMVLRSPISRLGRLCFLKMVMSEESSFASLEPLSGCHHLTKLRLNGIILEDPHSSLHNLEYLPGSLAKLSLINSKLKNDPMGILNKQPNLRFLDLGSKSYEGSEMVCSAHGFPQLETLRLSGLHVLEWKIEEGAMPFLKDLSLTFLRELKTIPEGLKFVSSLQKLDLFDMAQEFTKRVKVIDGVEGEDFDKVCHIPSIIVHTFDYCP
ncbi:hypothetical protein P3X46_025595 [Hevea brasiliensis]|uniref:Uncharacterized protein n=1 Tax=Hevea brasiliensis TaxID=3981 RepID=A0ABQ9L668_HEVBR|nr:probable disease resistance protein At1g58602 [Hevea brasiliensis]KAJ9160170.1 hypothetical protein P3X46_025595 [Hevea brasiliensis]